MKHLARLLRENGEGVRAARVEDAIADLDQALDMFLRSNELWGGAGSLADCAGMMGIGQRTDGRREIEHVLIQLGNEQIRAGNVNPRTEIWVEVFREWEKAGI